MIEYLSMEIYLEIFKYLYPTDIVRIRRVCKRWNLLIIENLCILQKYSIDLLICPIVTQNKNQIFQLLFPKITKWRHSSSDNFQIKQINIVEANGKFNFKIPTISIKKLFKCLPH